MPLESSRADIFNEVVSIHPVGIGRHCKVFALSGGMDHGEKVDDIGQ